MLVINTTVDWVFWQKWQTPLPSYKATCEGPGSIQCVCAALHGKLRLAQILPSGKTRKQQPHERNVLVPREIWCQSHDMPRTLQIFSRETRQPIRERCTCDWLISFTPTFLTKTTSNDQQRFLLDRSAEMSFFPATRADRLYKSYITLRAADNSSAINTYQFQTILKVSISGSHTPWPGNHNWCLAANYWRRFFVTARDRSYWRTRIRSRNCPWAVYWWSVETHIFF